MSKEYEDYSENKEIDPKNMELSEFMGAYFREGLECLVMVDNKKDTCNYSFVYLIGYVFSLFVLQLSLTYVSDFILLNFFLTFTLCSSWA